MLLHPLLQLPEFNQIAKCLIKNVALQQCNLLVRVISHPTDMPKTLWTMFRYTLFCMVYRLLYPHPRHPSQMAAVIIDQGDKFHTESALFVLLNTTTLELNNTSTQRQAFSERTEWDWWYYFFTNDRMVWSTQCVSRFLFLFFILPFSICHFSVAFFFCQAQGGMVKWTRGEENCRTKSFKSMWMLFASLSLVTRCTSTSKLFAKHGNSNSFLYCIF